MIGHEISQNAPGELALTDDGAIGRV
jgi:hypothetical protein